MEVSENVITIVGCGPGSADYITPAASNAVANATVLVSGVLFFIKTPKIDFTEAEATYPSDEEIAENGQSAGNKKLVPIVSRHGEGIQDGDYINCHMKGWCAQIKEGQTRFELEKKQNKPSSGQQTDF